MRSAILLISALTAGLSYGRKYLSNQVDERKNTAIESATADARRRIRDQADVFVQRSFISFAQAVAVKAAIISIIWALWWGGAIDGKGLTIFVSVALASFMIRDIFVSWPTAHMVIQELRRHGWQPRRAIGEVISAHVFEQVLVEANALPQSQSNRFIIWLAGRDSSRMHEEIAEAVASVAREQSWSDLKPYILTAAERIGAVAGMYSLLVWLVLQT
ncbi:MAG: hypothetical protein ACRBEQ_07055 [Hyphomonas sp.]